MISLRHSQATELWGNVAEWTTAGLAFLALAASIGAVLYTLRSERRHRLIELHDLLTSVESQRGRRILHAKMRTREDIEKISRKSQSTDFDTVNRAVGLYNTLGIYVKEKYVDRDLALKLWGPTIKGSWDRIEPFVVFRRERNGDSTKWEPPVWFAKLCGAEVSIDTEPDTSTKVSIRRGERH